MLIKREYLINNSKGMIINRVEIYWLKRNFLLVLEEGHKKKRREAWKQSCRGVVWEDMKFWNIWGKIASVICCCFEYFSPIS